MNTSAKSDNACNQSENLSDQVPERQVQFWIVRARFLHQRNQYYLPEQTLHFPFLLSLRSKKLQENFLIFGAFYSKVLLLIF